MLKINRYAFDHKLFSKVKINKELVHEKTTFKKNSEAWALLNQTDKKENKFPVWLPGAFYPIFLNEKDFIVIHNPIIESKIKSEKKNNGKKN